MTAIQRGILSLLILAAIHATAIRAEDWPKYRHDLNNSGTSGESSITSSNVSSLRLKWQYPANGGISVEPAIATVNGTSMEFFGAWNGWFFALNAVTGQLIWEFQVDLVGPCSPNNCRIASSANVTNGIVYFGAENAYLYALNAATGALVWKQQLAHPNSGYEIWSSPAVYNGVVYVGLASHNDIPCVVGQVVARNASTGAAVWSFSTIDQSTCPGGNCVGAGVWASPALDVANGILYVGTGNPGSTCSPSTPNASKYPDSILALRMSNGQLVNYYQAMANDNSDFDFGSSPLLWASAMQNTCTGQVNNNYWVAEASKNGNVYMCGRGSGGLGSCSVNPPSANGIIASMAESPDGSVQGPYYCGNGNYGFIQYMWGRLSVAVANGFLYELNQNSYARNGLSVQWSATVWYPTAVYSAPTYTGATTLLVLVGSNDRNLYGYSRTNGTKLWSYATGGYVYGGASISNGRVYFGSTDGYMRCLSLNGQ